MSSRSDIFLKQSSTLFFWASICSFSLSASSERLLMVASICSLRSSTETAASRLSAWSAWILIPPFPGGTGTAEKASLASLLWSTMLPACETISEVLQTTSSMPSTPGLTAICWMLGARLTI